MRLKTDFSQSFCNKSFTTFSLWTIYSYICLNMNKEMSEENILPEKNNSITYYDSVAAR